MTPMFAMTVDPWILTFSAVTVVATIFMGFWSARRSKTASDFFVAGRSVSVGWNASAISGEYLSAASFMGVAGMVMSSGYDALWYPVCYACGYLFLLLFIAGPLRRFGAYTIPDFAEGRFDSPLFRKIAVCFVLFIGFFYTMPQMKGAGTTLAYIFQDVDLRGGWLEFLAPHSAAGEAIKGFPYWAGVLVVGAVITLNVALGGMKGITLVQAFQYWAKMFAISVPIFVLMAVYGHYGKQLGENSPKPSSATSSSSERFFPQTWKVTAINGNSNELFLTYNEAKAAVSRAVGKPSLHAGNLDVFTALRFFAENHGHHRMLMAQSAPSFPQMTNPISVTTISTAEKWEQDVRAGLRSNGVDVIVTEAALVVVPAAKIADYEAAYRREGSAAFIDPTESSRKPLPEKAPADSTWLSPFGPLTTKAAKAAKPIVSYSGPLVRKESHVSKSGPVGSTNPTFFMAPGEDTIAGMVEHYASFVIGNGVANIDTDFAIEFPEAFENTKLKWTEDSDGSEIELADRLLKFLQANGVTIVRDGKFKFRTFPTKDAVIKPIDPKPYSLLYTYSLIIALVCGTAGLPHILVRFYTNPDGVAAKRTTMWVMILIGIFYVFPPVFGVMGRNLFPELYNGIGAKGTDKIVLELPRLLNEKYAPLGSILSGITCAGAFAAFMSTFSGLLVSMTGAMAHDVYGRMLRPKSTSAERMKMFKVCAVIVGGVAILLGMQVEALEINFMVGQAFAIAAASYFPLLFMAAWWRNLTMKGAATGMLAGGISALVGISLTSFSTLALAPGKTGEMFSLFKPLNDFWAHHPLARILCEQPAIWAVPLAITLMIVISKLTRKDVPADIRMKMLVLHAPEKLGLKQEYIQEHQHGH